jgi:hypothetical protein
MEEAMVRGMAYEPLRRGLLERCVIDVRTCGARIAAVRRGFSRWLALARSGA